MFHKPIATAVIAALLMTGTLSPVSPTSGQGAQLPKATPMTEAEVITIALDHAQLTEADTTGLRAQLDRDDRLHWDIRWRSGDWTYDCDIDPEKGTVLDFDRDYEPRRTGQTTPTASEPTQPERLTREQAQAIALDHAGLTADQVTGLRIRLDTEDRTAVYEIEFRVGRTEYEYELHAETGRILDFDRDTDD